MAMIVKPNMMAIGIKTSEKDIIESWPILWEYRNKIGNIANKYGCIVNVFFI